MIRLFSIYLSLQIENQTNLHSWVPATNKTPGVVTATSQLSPQLPGLILQSPTHQTAPTAAWDHTIPLRKGKGAHKIWKSLISTHQVLPLLVSHTFSDVPVTVRLTLTVDLCTFLGNGVPPQEGPFPSTINTTLFLPDLPGHSFSASHFLQST